MDGMISEFKLMGSFGDADLKIDTKDNPFGGSLFKTHRVLQQGGLVKPSGFDKRSSILKSAIKKATSISKFSKKSFKRSGKRIQRKQRPTQEEALFLDVEQMPTGEKLRIRRQKATSLMCRFWPKCKRKHCAFKHPSIDRKKCRYGKNCRYLATCRFDHGLRLGDENSSVKSSVEKSLHSSGRRIRVEKECKFGVRCNKKDTCLFMHAGQICRFDGKCRGRGCQDIHPSRGEQLTS